MIDWRSHIIFAQILPPFKYFLTLMSSDCNKMFLTRLELNGCTHKVKGMTNFAVWRNMKRSMLCSLHRFTYCHIYVKKSLSGERRQLRQPVLCALSLDEHIRRHSLFGLENKFITVIELI